MSIPTKSTHEISKQLLDFEKISCEENCLQSLHHTACVCEKLHTVLANFVGTEGFTFLLTRAKKLASANFAWLLSLEICADGTFDTADVLSNVGDSKTIDSGCEHLIFEF